MDYKAPPERTEAYEMEMKEALASGDEINYFLLCNQLRVEPEDRKLYIRGQQMHEMLWRRTESNDGLDCFIGAGEEANKNG